MKMRPSAWAALAKGEQPAEPAVSSAVRWVGKQARRIVKIEARADDEFDAADLACRKMRSHHAVKRVAVGDGDCREPERPCRRHQLLGVRAAAQEGEIGGDVELGVAGHFYCATASTLACSLLERAITRTLRADTRREGPSRRSPDRGLRGTPSSGGRPHPRCGNSRACAPVSPSP